MGLRVWCLPGIHKQKLTQSVLPVKSQQAGSGDVSNNFKLAVTSPEDGYSSPVQSIKLFVKHF